MYGFRVLDNMGKDCVIVEVSENHIKWWGTDRDGLTQVWSTYINRDYLKTEWMYGRRFKLVVFELPVEA